MAGEGVKPGSWVGDSVEEFKKLPPWGKGLAALALIGAAGIGFYEYQKSKNSGTAVSSTGSTTAATDPNAAAGGLQSPFGQVPTSAGNGSTVPVIPWGDTPIFDGQGNLIGWRQPNPNQPPGFTLPAGLSGMKVWQGTKTHDFWFGPKGPQRGGGGQTLLSTLFPAGTIFGINPDGTWTFTLPGTTTPVAGGTTVNPNPPANNIFPHNTRGPQKVPPPPVHKAYHTSPPPPPKVVVPVR